MTAHGTDILQSLAVPALEVVDWGIRSVGDADGDGGATSPPGTATGTARAESMQTAHHASTRGSSRSRSRASHGTSPHPGSTLVTADGGTLTTRTSPPRFLRGTHIIAPMPGLVRRDAHAALCGRFGAGSRCLRSGARVEALRTTRYCRAGDVGTVWRTSARKVVVRLDCGAENIVLPACAFTLRSFEGDLRPARNIGGFVDCDFAYTAKPKTPVFQLLTAESSTHVHENEIEYRLVAKSGFPFANKSSPGFDVMKLPMPEEFKKRRKRMGSPYAGTAGKVFELTAADAKRRRPARKKAAGDTDGNGSSSSGSGSGSDTDDHFTGGVRGGDADAHSADDAPVVDEAVALAALAAGLVVCGVAVHDSTFFRPAVYEYVVVRPDPAAAPPHTAFLVASAETLLGATAVDPYTDLPAAASPATTHTTVLVLGATAALHAHVVAQARRLYAAAFVVLDCDTLSVLYSRPKRGGTRMVAVANGQDMVWRCIDDLLRGDLCVWRYARERDVYGRRVVLPCKGASGRGGVDHDGAEADALSVASSAGGGDDGVDVDVDPQPRGGLVGRLLEHGEIRFTITGLLGNCRRASAGASSEGGGGTLSKAEAAEGGGAAGDNDDPEATARRSGGDEGPAPEAPAAPNADRVEVGASARPPSLAGPLESPEVATFVDLWPPGCSARQIHMTHALVLGAGVPECVLSRGAVAAFLTKVHKVPVRGEAAVTVVPMAARPAQPRTLMCFPGADLTPLVHKHVAGVAGIPVLGIVCAATVAVAMPAAAPLTSDDVDACACLVARCCAEAVRGARGGGARAGAGVVAFSPQPK